VEIIHKEIVKIYNYFVVLHLQKSENEMAKYFLTICEKFPTKDLECFLITKSNWSCYYNNIGQYRSARNIMNEIIKINLSRKSEEIQNIIDFNEKKNFNFSEIANDYSNLCALNNRIKQ